MEPNIDPEEIIIKLKEILAYLTKLQDEKKFSNTLENRN